MTLLQMLELAGVRISDWTGRHPIWTVVGIIAVFICSTVTVKKMELPVYHWARDWINKRLDGFGRRINAGVTQDVTILTGSVAELTRTVATITTELQAQKTTADRRRADDYRRDILRFNREIMEGGYPDRESYVEALAIIDLYTDYCRAHEDYPNSRATAAVENIKHHYQHCLAVGFVKEDKHGYHYQIPGGSADQCS